MAEDDNELTLHLEPEPFEVSEARIKHGDSSWEGFKKEYTFTLDELKALHKLLQHEYIPHEEEIIVVVRKINDIVNGEKK